MQLYKSYVFKDKDPVIDKLRTIVEDAGLKHSQVAEQSGISATTLHNWFMGDTKRPQFCTIAAVATALDYDIAFVKNGHRININKRRRGG